ncbi:ABC transporter ATP-binding protein [Falsiruegeria mediterranea]|uniref:Putative ABC transporter ATP-binding protein n=1 Tax=Falsiruegeria mediterranea M17 TaxID=1200281 RepID=A0A2R8C8W6_9RHOB|nr:ABC transporter ATP-binding protein [Falsiruegeria mediterranea]SPJ28880.1 putative ABC transporter ATP-binding protein [Falsiruegeria mediterranea M17]
MLLSIENVDKAYPGGRPVLTGVSLQLDRGETLALTGDSGSGKSTLLNLVATLDHFDAGEITLDQTLYSGLDDAGRAALRRSQVALVFQAFNLIPSLTVAQNLSFHARLAGVLDPAWQETLAERLGLTELLDRMPEQVSGGQQQRVAIGRAMALKPPLLLADEPTGNLDEVASAAVMDLMLELVRDAGSALLLVTHSPAIAARADRQVHLSQGQIA